MTLDCSRCFHHGCCVVFSVNLKPWEVDRYDVVKDSDGPYYLRRVGDGQCVYLSVDHKCMIHGRAPKACQEWSCEIDPRWPVVCENYMTGKDKQTGPRTGTRDEV